MALIYVWKNALFCDRRVYAFKGEWKSPQQDVAEQVYYFISKPMTLATGFKNGREQLVPTLEITIFGGKPICEKDFITLQDGSKYRVQDITINYLESNLLVRDMLKQRIESQVLVLQ